MTLGGNGEAREGIGGDWGGIDQNTLREFIKFSNDKTDHPASSLSLSDLFFLSLSLYSAYFMADSWVTLLSSLLIQDSLV